MSGPLNDIVLRSSLEQKRSLHDRIIDKHVLPVLPLMQTTPNRKDVSNVFVCSG